MDISVGPKCWFSLIQTRYSAQWGKACLLRWDYYQECPQKKEKEPASGKPLEDIEIEQQSPQDQCGSTEVENHLANSWKVNTFAYPV